MELGRVGLFICSQKPIGISSDHCVKKPPPRPAKGQQEPATAGRYGRAPRPNCFDYQQYVPRHPDRKEGAPVPERTLPARHTPPAQRMRNTKEVGGGRSTVTPTGLSRVADAVSDRSTRGFSKQGSLLWSTLWEHQRQFPGPFTSTAPGPWALRGAG